MLFCCCNTFLFLEKLLHWHDECTGFNACGECGVAAINVEPRSVLASQRLSELLSTDLEEWMFRSGLIESFGGHSRKGVRPGVSVPNFLFRNSKTKMLNFWSKCKSRNTARVEWRWVQWIWVQFWEMLLASASRPSSTAMQVAEEMFYTLIQLECSVMHFFSVGPLVSLMFNSVVLRKISKTLSKTIVFRNCFWDAPHGRVPNTRCLCFVPGDSYAGAPDSCATGRRGSPSQGRPGFGSSWIGQNEVVPHSLVRYLGSPSRYILSGLSWVSRWGAGAFSIGTRMLFRGGIPFSWLPSIFRVPFSKLLIAFTQDSCSKLVISYDISTK